MRSDSGRARISRRRIATTLEGRPGLRTTTRTVTGGEGKHPQQKKDGNRDKSQSGKKNSRSDDKGNNDKNPKDSKRQKTDKKKQEDLLPEAEIKKRLDRIRKYGHGPSGPKEEGRLKAMLRKYRFKAA